MKNIIILTLFLFYGSTFSQVVIGGPGPVTNNSVSLEYGTGNKGVVLPWASSNPDASKGYLGMNNAEQGTLIFDISDYRFKVCKDNLTGSNPTWINLSDTGSGSDGKYKLINIEGTTGNDITTNRTIQDNKNEVTVDAKVAIGTTQSNTPGILVLEDTNKAMILPKVASPHLNVKNPAPGMMVYDTDSKMVAFFNGSVWSYMH